MKNPCIPSLVPDAFVSVGEKTWRFDNNFPPKLLLENGCEILFHTAGNITVTPIHNGLGTGQSVLYEDFPGHKGLAFETRTLIQASTGFVDCSFVPLNMADLPVQEILWPQPLAADGPDDYAVLNTMQGQLLPSHWPRAVGENLPFHGQMCSESAYMPWWGEITPNGGYLCFVRQSWDSAYTIHHPPGGPTRLYIRHLPSLGKFGCTRTITYCFVPSGSDYVTLCRLYRSIADEEGIPRTLKEKAFQNPNIKKLVGCCVMHCEGKTHVSPDSYYYNNDEPEKNDRLIPFSHWTERVKQLKALGIDQLYLHLDGWGQPGYDNQHPDYLPACREAGGWEGLKELSDTMKDCGYMLGLHDQYRDYYLDASSYDPDNAVTTANGTLIQLARWAGGKQNFLCASLAFDYVRRNFSELFTQGIHLEGAYLDVFTCNELDECANPRHPMTRRECIEARNRCFHYLNAHGVAPSSEEVNEWAVGAQVFCHWAPYMEDCAIPVPLYNLVYHDCVLIPWMMPAGCWGIPKGQTGFLHCLLNGGMAYLDEHAEGEALAENIRQWQVVRELQDHVAMEQMVEHRFLDLDRLRQQTLFSDGTRVTVDFAANTYEIAYPPESL